MALSPPVEVGLAGSISVVALLSRPATVPEIVHVPHFASLSAHFDEHVSHWRSVVKLS